MKDEIPKILIVGGGLAGMFLAANLVKAGRRVVLFSDPFSLGASDVAAGLVNPITGRQYVLTWRAKEFLNHLEAFLSDARFRALQKYYHVRPVFRPFPDIFSSNEWTSKTSSEEFNGITQAEFSPWKPELIRNPFGGMVHQKSGWMDIPGFLSELKKILLTTGLFELKNSRLPYDAIHPESKFIQIEGEQLPYQHLVFCEGIQGRINPWFRLQILPLKGQILTVQTQGDAERILSSGIFMIPLGQNQYRLGSTYERAFTEEGPDEKGKAELLQEAARWWLPKFDEVLNHTAGLRPTTPDRMPLIGHHQTLTGLWIFNGLGAKGVLQGPGLARLLSEAILNETPEILWPETNIYRSKAVDKGGNL